MNNVHEEFNWNPTEFFSLNNSKLDYSVIILNRPVNIPFDCNVVLNLWKNAKVKITVDGGTDRWLSFLQSNCIDPQSIDPPDLVTGDMDSISEETLERFRKTNRTRVVVTEDQDETDFTKAIIELKKYTIENQLKIRHVMVLSDVSGRFDHVISGINTLFKACDILPATKVYMAASDSLSWLLVGGTHTITIPLRVRLSGDWCSLVPFGEESRVTTSGLKWNLETVLKFGQMVSTSNTYNGDAVVVVSTDKAIIWSMGIGKLSA